MTFPDYSAFFALRLANASVLQPLASAGPGLRARGGLLCSRVLRDLVNNQRTRLTERCGRVSHRFMRRIALMAALSTRSASALAPPPEITLDAARNCAVQMPADTPRLVMGSKSASRRALLEAMGGAAFETRVADRVDITFRRLQ